MTSPPPSLQAEETTGWPSRLLEARAHGAVLATGVAVLGVAHLLTGLPDRTAIPLWSPAAGVALVLAFWFGLTGAVLAGAVGILVRTVAGQPFGVVGGVLDGVEAYAAFRFYVLLQGARQLNDPRSATVFLLVAPVIVAGCSAGLRAALFAGTASLPLPLTTLLARIWIGRALGMLTLAPPLLVVLTPSLARRQWISPSVDPAVGLPLERPGYWGWFEVCLLGIGTGGYALLLVLAVGRTEAAAWQIWGVPLIFIVWSSFRHGLVGGTVTAALAAVLPLATAEIIWPADAAHALLSCNFIAQCSTALLAATSAGWIRASEARYRRVVGHIPVLLYSARILARSKAVEAETEHNVRRTPRSGRHGPSPVPEVEITFVSPACQDLFACAPEELLGSYDAWVQRVDPRDREIVQAAVVQVGRQRQPVTCEYRLVSREGKARDRDSDLFLDPTPRSTIRGTRWVRDTLAPSFRPDGTLDGWEGVLTEITEQRVLADDLRRTTTMFHGLVANLPAGVFFVQGASGRPLLVNARARQLLGQREDAAAGLQHLAQVYRLHRPDGTPYPTDELPVALALRRGQTTMRDDIVVHRPDGRRLPLITWAAPVDLAGHGSPDAAVWVLEDLTALRRAEAARRETEARLRTVIETMAEGLVVQDAAGRVVECNPAAAAVLGLSTAALHERPLTGPQWNWCWLDGSPLPPEEHPATVSLNTGAPVRNVLIGVRAVEGDASSSATTVRWLLVNSMPLGPGANRVVTTFADITTHLETLRGLQASEERYRGLVESLPLALVQFDAIGRVAYMNPAAEILTGYCLAEVAGDVFSPAATAPTFLTALATTEPAESTRHRNEIRFHHRSGEERVAYVLLRSSDSPAGPCRNALLVDMTRERRLEEDLQRAQRLDLVGRLASGIAHDFNNLLTVILTLVDLTRTRLPGDHAAQRDLSAMADAATHAGQLAGQLLAFSKQRRSPARRVSLNAVVRRTLDMLRSTLPVGVEVTTELSPEDPHVRGDEPQLLQVLMNLCLNARDAIQATENGAGQLLVRTESDRNSAGPTVRLSVRDTGVGMTDEVLQRLFDPFFSTKERGTGLGLAVVQQLVEHHRGRVEVWSRPGEGSEFQVWMPLADD